MIMSEGNPKLGFTRHCEHMKQYVWVSPKNVFSIRCLWH